MLDFVIIYFSKGSADSRLGPMRTSMRMQKRSAILQPHTLCEDAGGLIVELYIESVDCCYVANCLPIIPVQ